MNGLTCNLKSSGKYERWEKGECTLHRCKNHERSVVVLDHFKNFKGTQLIVGYNIKNEEGIREKEIIVRNLKGKVKN